MSSVETYYDVIAGTIGGAAGVFAGAPLDLIKVRLQGGQYQYTGAFDAIRSVLTKEGPTAFFKGILPPLLSNMPMNALIFAGYGTTARSLSQYIYDKEAIESKSTHILPLCFPRPSKQSEENLVNYLLSTTTLTDNTAYTHQPLSSSLMPLSSNISLNNSLSYTPPLSLCSRNPSTAATIIETNRNITISTLYDIDTRLISLTDPVIRNNYTIPFIGGCISGVFNALIAGPFEMIKILQQNDSTIPSSASSSLSATSIVRNLVRIHGISSLFRGMGATLYRDVPSMGVYFVVYEWFKSMIRLDTFVPCIQSNSQHVITPRQQSILPSSSSSLSQDNNTITNQQLSTIPPEYTDRRYAFIESHRPFLRRLIPSQMSSSSPSSSSSSSSSSSVPLVVTPSSSPQRIGFRDLYIKAWDNVQAHAAPPEPLSVHISRDQSLISSNGSIISPYLPASSSSSPHHHHHHHRHSVTPDNITNQSNSNVPPDHYTITWTYKPQYNTLLVATAGALAGAACWASTYPVDLVKTQIQAMPISQYLQERPTTMGLIRHIYRTKGVSALFIGLPTTVINAMPVNAVIFVAYEQAMRLCMHYKLFQGKSASLSSSSMLPAPQNH